MNSRNKGGCKSDVYNLGSESNDTHVGTPNEQLTKGSKTKNITFQPSSIVLYSLAYAHEEKLRASPLTVFKTIVQKLVSSILYIDGLHPFAWVKIKKENGGYIGAFNKRI